MGANAGLDGGASIVCSADIIDELQATNDLQF